MGKLVLPVTILEMQDKGGSSRVKDIAVEDVGFETTKPKGSLPEPSQGAVLTTPPMLSENSSKYFGGSGALFESQLFQMDLNKFRSISLNPKSLIYQNSDDGIPSSE